MRKCDDGYLTLRCVSVNTTTAGASTRPHHQASVFGRSANGGLFRCSTPMGPAAREPSVGRLRETLLRHCAAAVSRRSQHFREGSSSVGGTSVVTRKLAVLAAAAAAA